MPNLSFGTHLSSEVGEIGRMGVVEQSLDRLMKAFDQDSVARGPTAIRFMSRLIRRNFGDLDRFGAKLDLPEMARGHTRENARPLWSGLTSPNWKTTCVR